MKKRILIADDDPSIVEAIKLILEEGYQTLTVRTGDEIYKLKRYPDLFLLDIWMAGHNGMDICLYLKGKKETSKIPVIIISANKDTEEIAKKAGADAFILKPFEIDDLLSTIVKLIK